MIMKKSCESPADVEGKPTTTSEPEPKQQRTALTIAPEGEPQSESDQGCESSTPVAEVTEMEDWLIDFNVEVLTPILSQPVPESSLLYLDSRKNRLDCDFSLF